MDTKTMLDLVRTQGIKRTLHDHVLIHFQPNTLWQFRSATSSAARLLQHSVDDGLNYSNLAGTLVFPSTKKTGVSPKWAGDAPTMDNMVETPDWASTSTAVVALAKTYSNIGFENATATALINATAKLGKKNYILFTEGFAALAEIAGDNAAKAQTYEARVRAVEKALAFATTEMQNLRLLAAPSEKLAVAA